jgi:hypothetical protein
MVLLKFYLTFHNTGSKVHPATVANGCEENLLLVSAPCILTLAISTPGTYCSISKHGKNFKVMIEPYRIACGDAL